jgi:HK97 family phage prohead protease
MERRIISSNEIRMAGNGNRISGTAARYNVRTNLGKFHEQISQRAFDRILRTSPDVVCLFNHDPNFVLGRTTNGTLNLRADDAGLHYTCNLPNTSTARDLRESIKRGDINGCSFAFTLGEGDDSWSEEEDENRSRIVVRTIRNFSSLLDVSCVTYPAYSGTAVGADRSLVGPAEVRSRAERVARVHAIAAKRETRKERFARLGVTNEVSLGDVYDTMDRRKDLLNFVLED